LQHKGIEIWARPIAPIYQNYYSYAIAFVNRRTDGTPSDVSVTLKELGLQYPGGYRVEVCSVNVQRFNWEKSLRKEFGSIVIVVLFRICTRTWIMEYWRHRPRSRSKWIRQA